MILTLDGEPLLIPTAEVLELIRPEALTEVFRTRPAPRPRFGEQHRDRSAFGSNAAGSPTPCLVGGFEPPRWRERPPLSINQFWWPHGASRFGCGHFLREWREGDLFRGDGVLRISPESLSRHRLPHESFSVGVTIVDEQRLAGPYNRITKDWSSLSIVSLADYRYHLQEEARKCGPASLYESNLDGASWLDLIELLVDRIQGLDYGPSIEIVDNPHADYLSPDWPTFLNQIYSLSFTEMLDAACACCGLWVEAGVNAAGGSHWRIRQVPNIDNLPAYGDNTPDVLWQLESRGRIGLDVRLLVGGDHHRDDGTQTSISDREQVQAIVADSTSGSHRQSIAIETSAWAEQSAGTPDNAAELTALAERIRDDWEAGLLDLAGRAIRVDTVRTLWDREGYPGAAVWDLGALRNPIGFAADNLTPTRRDTPTQEATNDWGTTHYPYTIDEIPRRMAHRGSYKPSCNWARYIEWDSPDPLGGGAARVTVLRYRTGEDPTEGGDGPRINSWNGAPAGNAIYWPELHEWRQGGQLEWEAVMTSAVVAGGTGTAQFRKNGSLVSQTVTVYYDWITILPALVAGARVRIRWFEDRSKWCIVDHGC